MKKFFILPLILLMSCGDENFKKVEQLDGFRILAIRATNPEVAPGGSSSLSLFVSDTKGPMEGRVISGTSVACIDPGISLGAPVTCDHDPNRMMGTYTVDTTTPDFFNNRYSGYSGNVSITVPSSILEGRNNRERVNGVGYIIIFNFDVDGQEVTAFKRIIATERTALNVNPTGTTILLNGSLFAGTPVEGDKFLVNTSTPESYIYVSVDGTSGTRTEEIDVAWYIPEAEFDKPKANLGQAVKLATSPPSTPFVIVTVIRDDRGGVEVVRTTVTP